ncbi:MAG: aromatic acid exporter family protein [Angelakisella sp.]
MRTEQSVRRLPKIGLRNLKTAISATLCALLYLFIDRNPTFACIGAVFGMDNSLESSWKTGGNRLAGTVIGGFLGMGLFFVYLQLPNRWMRLLLLFVGIMILIYLSQLLHFPGAIQAGSVVFFIVMLNTPQNAYISYALNRMVDTGIGVMMSICMNQLLSRERIDRWLGRGATDQLNLTE